MDIQYRRGGGQAAKRARAVEMLRRVRLPDPERRLNQYPHEFSGGMRQRIAIAMALMAEPALLIADEPTTALDATLELATIELLKTLQREIGCAILFVSHHLGVIAELCDRVNVMYAGEVVETGDIRSVFHNPRHPYTQRLLACDPARMAERSRRLPTIPGELPDLVNLPAGCVFADRCPAVFEPAARRHRISTAGRGPRRALLSRPRGRRAMSALLEVRDLVVRFGGARSLARLVTGRSDPSPPWPAPPLPWQRARPSPWSGIRLRQDDPGTRSYRADAVGLG